MKKGGFRNRSISALCGYFLYYTNSEHLIRCYADGQHFHRIDRPVQCTVCTGNLRDVIFPTLLLFTTLFRISLNVSSTRLILTTGDPGNVVETFGSFVGGGDMIIGGIIFIVLVLIQFIVINKGSERVSEVTARFTLDAMPGKQMAIDADLNTGTINEKQARERREKIQAESSFFGAMDGATKYVKEMQLPD